jgi:CheY-like chemotaxis protein
MDAPRDAPLVLIVEDDASAARMLAQLLREDGYRVEVALDGAVAIRRLGEAPHPDVLVVDYRLPRTDGLEVARYARDHLPSARIFMVTSYSEVVESLLRAQSSSAILIPKPLAYDQLAQHLAAR